MANQLKKLISGGLSNSDRIGLFAGGTYAVGVLLGILFVFFTPYAIFFIIAAGVLGVVTFRFGRYMVRKITREVEYYSNETYNG